MADPIASSPSTWTWPADVKARLDAQRIAIPEPKAPEPAKPAAEKTDPTEELLSYMFGGF